jgi:hypothetical protein
MASTVEYLLSMLTMAKPWGPSEFFGFPAKRIEIPESPANRKIVLSDATQLYLEELDSAQV